jgi:hypothetical protein
LTGADPNLSGYDSSWNIMDQTLNGGVAQFAVLRKQTVSLKVLRHRHRELPGPGSAVTGTLPLGAIITSIRLFAPAGASAGTSTAWKFTGQIGDRRDHYHAAELRRRANRGGHDRRIQHRSHPDVRVHHLDNRDITLTGGGSNSASGGAALCLVEYLS